MNTLTDYEERLLGEDSAEGRAFRAGASAEARQRNADTLVHRELVQYVRTMAEMHPEMTSGAIAASAARVFVDPPTECDAEKFVHVGPWRHIPGSDSLNQCQNCEFISGK